MVARSHVRGYMAVFGALLVLTVATVAASYLTLSPTATVVLGLTIATAKASLVALFFMHLKGERPWVVWTLALTAVLFVALFALTLWTEADHIVGPLDSGVDSTPSSIVGRTVPGPPETRS